jgi:hypothetical protein
LSDASYKQRVSGLGWRLRTNLRNLFFKRTRQGLEHVEDTFRFPSLLSPLIQPSAAQDLSRILEEWISVNSKKGGKE